MVYAYLSFNGNCRAAMLFYQQCLGGSLAIQSVGDGPLTGRLPARLKDYIVQATLKKEGLVLMGTDIVPEDGWQKGNAISLMLYCTSRQQINAYYKKLSAGGMATQPVKKTAHGALFGTLTDKYGNHWLLHCDLERC